jgi:putative ABC transport system permease protein
MLPITLPGWTNVDFDLPVVGFLSLISLLAGAALGILPALHASRTPLSEGLKESGRTAAVAGGRLRSVLVTAEVALALTLLVGAGLMARTFQNLLRTDPGFNPSNLLTVRISLPRLRYPDPDRRKAFYREALARIRSLPGVKNASAVSWLPLTRLTWTQAYSVEGEPPPASRRYPQADNRIVMPGYFQTMGIPVIRGRVFDEHDGLAGNEQVVIVNESLAKRHWLNDNPIGKRLKYEGPQPAPPWMTVVGVVRDVRQNGLQVQTRIGLYVPMEQWPVSGMTLAVRTDGDPLSLGDAVRAQIAAIDPDLPLFNLLSMHAVLRQSLWQTVLASRVMGAFALMALVLATVGLYGVISYRVGQRTREIGVRIALGASPGGVRRQVVFQGALLALTGAAIGFAASIALMRLMSGLLFGVSATDPLTIGVVALVLMGAAVLASYIPARRASRVDPVAALRCE